MTNNYLLATLCNEHCSVEGEVPNLRCECGVGNLKNLSICWYVCQCYFNSIMIPNNGFGCLFPIPKWCRLSDSGASCLSSSSKYSVGYSHLKMAEHSDIDGALIGRRKVILVQIALCTIIFFSLRLGAVGVLWLAELREPVMWKGKFCHWLCP